MSEKDDEQARKEQAERWREEIEAAKSGREKAPESPREFTDPHRYEPEPDDEDLGEPNDDV
jgi:hypothetical protein